MAIYYQVDEIKENLEGLARTTVENLQRSQSNATRHGDLPEVESQSAIRDVFVNDSFIESASGARVNTSLGQVSLETLGWNLVNASYAERSADISTNTSDSKELAFKPDGTKMYVLDKQSGADNTVRQYDLAGDPWNVSGASYELGSTLSNTTENKWKGLAFKPDGTRMYIVNGNDSANAGLVQQYDMDDNPWEITDASFSFKEFNDGAFANESSWKDAFFKPDGTKMYLVGNDESTTSDYLFEVDLSTPWDLGNAAYNGVFYDVSAEVQNASALSVKNNGGKVYVMGNLRIYQYDLSADWDLSTASYDDVSYDGIVDQDSDPTGLFMRRDGRKMYVLGEGNRSVYEYDVPSTSWGVSAVQHEGNVFEFPNLQYKKYEGVTFGKSGEKFYGVGEDTGETDTSPNPAEIVQYEVPSPYEVNSIETNPRKLEVESEDQKPVDVSFKSDGTKMYVLGSDTDEIYEYVLSVPWDIESAYYTGNFFSNVRPGVEAISFRPNGTSFYANDGGIEIYQYDLDEPWSVSTASEEKVLNLGGGIEGDDFVWSAKGLHVDERKVLVLGNNELDEDKVYEYILAEDWNLGNVGPDGAFVNSYVLSEIGIEAFGIRATPEGENLHVIAADDSGNNEVHKYRLVEYYESGEFSSKTKTLNVDQAYAALDDYGITDQTSITVYLEDQSNGSVEVPEGRFVDIGELGININARFKLESENQQETPVLQSYGIHLKEDI